MNGNLKETLDKIQAEESLKENTRQFLLQKTNHYTSKKKTSSVRWVAAAACFLFAFFGISGYQAYFTPVSAISIDINPSIELGINRFDRVISVEGYNEDGQILADSLDIRFLNYTDALNEILENEMVVDCLSRNEIMSISVAGKEEEQSSEILAQVESCTRYQQNVYCQAGNYQQVEDAHTLGLSFGKYQAYLELKELDSQITPEEVQGMTMREIRDRIAALSPQNPEESPWFSPGGKGPGSGQGAGQGFGWGSGAGGNGRKNMEE